MQKDIFELQGKQISTAIQFGLLICLSMVVVAAPQIRQSFHNANFMELCISVSILGLIAYLFCYISPKLSPKKSIRLGDNSLAMYQDNAINWHVLLTDIGSCDIQRQNETMFKSRAKILSVYNREGEKIIEQDIEFLNAEQHQILLGKIQSHC